ncbi:signal peptidase I [Dongia deserti]|uniref:signal peptidase I n=1 Tax=Dongia deserti TaxID=2268030 RepID=UPI0013C477CA|nr:signal peptidase I [Dongia deserti]
MSLFLPGLGQLYNRDTHLALPLMVAAFLLPIPGLWLIAALPATVAALATAVAALAVIAFTLSAIVQAVIRARRAGAISLAWFNRWYVYIGLYVLLVIWQSAAPLVPISSVTGYSMPSGSMIPTLLVGDHFEARTRSFSGRSPERGELALFRLPSYPDIDFVKRIIGLPGDRVQLREGRLYLNDALVERVPLSDEEVAPLVQDLRSARAYRETLPGGISYLIAEIGDDEGLDNTPEYLVPADHVFVLGDYRDRSNDSRAKLGFIPIALLRDKPLFIFWSSDFSRLGAILE